MSKCVLFLICCLAPLFSHANWVTDQIREDLSPFEAEGIDRTAVCNLGKQLPWEHQLVLIRIRKDQVSFSLCIEESIIHPWTKTRLDIVKQFFKKLVRRYLLPDIDFLLSLHDSFEEDFNVPIFSFAKNRASSHTVLFPDFEALSDPNSLIRQCDLASMSHPWHLKQDKIFWRGATTGGIYQMHTYLDFPRVKLVFLSNEHSSWLDAAFTSHCQSSQDVLNLIAAQSRPLEPYVCMEDHFFYKYLIDIDGNSCTYSRCRWILLSNSTLLKPDSPNIQWYYKAMQPWEHYVPLRADLSDLLDTYTWLQSHGPKLNRLLSQGTISGISFFQKRLLKTMLSRCLANTEDYRKSSGFLMKSNYFALFLFISCLFQAALSARVSAHAATQQKGCSTCFSQFKNLYCDNTSQTFVTLGQEVCIDASINLADKRWVGERDAETVGSYGHICADSVPTDVDAIVELLRRSF